MDKNPAWLEIKQNLLIKTSLCKINGFTTSVKCPIPDNAENLTAIINEYMSGTTNVDESLINSFNFSTLKFASNHRSQSLNISNEKNDSTASNFSNTTSSEIAQNSSIDLSSKSFLTIAFKIDKIYTTKSFIIMIFIIIVGNF